MPDAAFYLWARTLQQVDASRLLLKSAAFRNLGPADRMRAFFADHGIEAERIALLPDDVTHLGHLQRYAEVDIALDVFPYQGMATTCEALWMGVPVISLTGNRSAARYGQSLLNAAGLSELSASSEEEFVSTAVRLANDREMLKEKNGIILVTGGTGSGKTTTLAAMLNELNATQQIHIVTLEDPIEYRHSHRQAAMSQRELGNDFPTFASAW